MLGVGVRDRVGEGEGVEVFVTVGEGEGSRDGVGKEEGVLHPARKTSSSIPNVKKRLNIQQLCHRFGVGYKNKNRREWIIDGLFPFLPKGFT
jgi:hypothetical protein